MRNAQVSIILSSLLIIFSNHAFELPRKPEHQIDFRKCIDGVIDDHSPTSLKLQVNDRGICSEKGGHFHNAVSTESWSWAGPLAVEVYFKLDRWTNASVFEFRTEAPGEADSISFEVSETNMQLSVQQAGTVSDMRFPVLVELNEWYHVVAVIDIGSVHFFVDGHLLSSTDVILFHSVRLARRIVILGDKLDGYLAYVRIWHKQHIDADQAKYLFLQRNANDVHYAQDSPPVNPRVAIVYHGQTSRWRDKDTVYSCSPQGIAHHNVTVKSQRDNFFTHLETLGWKPDIFMATDDCSETAGVAWEARLEEWYSPYLIKSFTTLSCCRLKHAIMALIDHEKVNNFKYDAIIITRPDLMIKPSGRELVGDMITKALKGIVWPFKCEEGAFDSWGCVADTFMALPRHLLEPYLNGCLGKAG